MATESDSTIRDQLLEIMRPKVHSQDSQTGTADETKVRPNHMADDVAIQWGGDIGPDGDGVGHAKTFATGPDGCQLRMELDEETFEAGRLGDGVWHACCWHGYDNDNKRVNTHRVLVLWKSVEGQWKVFRELISTSYISSSYDAI